jgi:hypothetical protein
MVDAASDCDTSASPSSKTAAPAGCPAQVGATKGRSTSLPGALSMDVSAGVQGAIFDLLETGP